MSHLGRRDCDQTRQVRPLIPWPLTSLGVLSLTFAGGECDPRPAPVFIIQAASVEPREAAERNGLLNSPVVNMDLRGSSARLWDLT